MPSDSHPESSSLWSRALPRLAERVGHATYDSFLRNTVAVDFDGETFVLGVPTQFAKEWLEDKHVGAIGDCLTEAAQRPVAVRMEVTEAAQASGAPQGSNASRPPEATVVSRPQETGAGLFGGTPLNPRYTFESFVVADCNRFAHAAALQVAKSPGQSYSPLFIHSKVGLGKTHLMQAIGHYVKQDQPSRRVAYLSTESFVNQVITAIREGRVEEFIHDLKQNAKPKGKLAIIDIKKKRMIWWPIRK